MTEKLIKSSIGKKFIMALSGVFLVLFLLVHLGVNLTILIGKETFDAASHFMKTNPIIYWLQYILAAGFIIHIVMGIILEIQNIKARPQKYAMEKSNLNASFASKNMIKTGILILILLLVHLYDFFVPIKLNNYSGSDYDLVVSVLSQPLYLIIYLIFFTLLTIHLSHGVRSSIQSLGINHKKYNHIIIAISNITFSFIGIGFSIIALYVFFIAN